MYIQVCVYVYVRVGVSACLRACVWEKLCLLEVYLFMCVVHVL